MSAPESPKGLADLPAAPQAPIPVEEWLKLNPRMIVVRPLHELVRVIPALIVIVIAGGHDTQRLWWTLGAIGLVIAHGVLHWFTTRYRVTDSQVELHTGVIFRQRLAVRRDRIRTVETTAKFGHRMFGLAEVRIGTGQHEQKKKGPLSLDAVAVSEANRLRRYLLQRSAPPNTAATGTEAPGPTTAGQGGTGTPRSRTLARLDWHWLRFAPLTLSGVAVVGAAVGFGFKIINDLNIAPDSVGPLRELLRWSGQRPIVIIALLALAVFVVLVVLFSVIGYVFGYAGFRLDRREDGTLHVSRGLLTTRSVTIEEAKLRGVLLREELLLRCGKGARLSAVTTGLDRKNDSSLLLPPAPRARAHAVAALALNATAETPTSASLARHPRGALQRRLTRTLVPAVGVILLLLILALSHQIPHWIWLGALVLIPLAAALGGNRYTNLGHALTHRYLISRSGSLRRQTVALQREGIIGWHVRQSIFQRRKGLLTLKATTSAGSGGYLITDVAAGHGLAFAKQAQPGLLEPFLEPRSG